VTSQYSDEVRSQLLLSDLVGELRTNSRRTNLYSISGAGKALKETNTQNNNSNFNSANEKKLREVEENTILKRWKSPSIIEAMQYPNAFRMIIFCTAIFFKFRVVNKRMQLYGN